MKIAFVLDDSLDKSDGVQQYVLTLGRWLKAEGHQVHYLVGHTLRSDIPNLHSLSRNVQVHFNQNRMSTPLPAKKQDIRQLMDKEKFDVLHVQMPYSPFLAGRIIKAANSRTAVVATFHIVPAARLESAAARVLRHMTKRSLKRIDRIISVSPPAAKFAKKTFKTDSAIVPNCVSLAQMHRGRALSRLSDGKVNIVYLGRLVERKGCLYFLKAIQWLHEHHGLQNVRVIICGKGPLEGQLKNYVKKHRLGSIVRFVGYVSETEKANYLASANIAVMPSTGGESFGIVLIEAMAAGAEVVIGGDNVGYRTVLNNRREQLVKPLDTKSFARTLRHFIIGNKARKSVSAWQKEWVVQFDVRHVGKALVRHYEEVIAKRVKAME